MAGVAYLQQLLAQCLHIPQLPLQLLVQALCLLLRNVARLLRRSR